jgi:hypothetical protein
MLQSENNKENRERERDSGLYKNLKEKYSDEAHPLGLIYRFTMSSFQYTITRLVSKIVRMFDEA